MGHTPHRSGAKRNASGPGKAVPSGAPSDTEQNARDVKEKRKHSASENSLQSAQDKNPVPPGSVRKS